MNFADWKNIAGLICIIVLPYLSGNLLKTVIRKKEIGQISHSETYLLGFFLVFLVQGVYFTIGHLVMKESFDALCDGFFIVTVALAAVSVVALILNIILTHKERKEPVYRQEYKKSDIILMGITAVILVLICLRIIGIIDYIRDDYILPTVRITLSTGTVNEYNPITALPYRVGLTTSKKIVTLPVYYAYLCRTFGLEPVKLLYVVLTLQTVVCSYLACLLFVRSFIKQREKLYIYGIFFGGLVLSGDYFNRSISARLLWNGYAGSTITTAVMLPYMTYLIVSCYRTGRMAIADILRILLVTATSLFITGITYGALLIVITAGATLIGCLITGHREFDEEDGRPAVMES